MDELILSTVNFIWEQPTILQRNWKGVIICYAILLISSFFFYVKQPGISIKNSGLSITDLKVLYLCGLVNIILLDNSPLIILLIEIVVLSVTIIIFYKIYPGLKFIKINSEPGEHGLEYNLIPSNIFRIFSKVIASILFFDYISSLILAKAFPLVYLYVTPTYIPIYITFSFYIFLMALYIFTERKLKNTNNVDFTKQWFNVCISLIFILISIVEMPFILLATINDFLTNKILSIVYAVSFLCLIFCLYANINLNKYLDKNNIVKHTIILISIISMLFSFAINCEESNIGFTRWIKPLMIILFVVFLKPILIFFYKKNTIIE